MYRSIIDNILNAFVDSQNTESDSYQVQCSIDKVSESQGSLLDIISAMVALFVFLFF